LERQASSSCLLPDQNFHKPEPSPQSRVYSVGRHTAAPSQNDGFQELPVTVLVVEDEALIRMDASDALQDAGFSTIEAANADEALDILGDRLDIDIVFTDVNMPGSIDGLGLMRRIANDRPEICMIVVSGMERPTLSSLAPRTRFFGKPYAYPGIIEAIHALRRG